MKIPSPTAFVRSVTIPVMLGSFGFHPCLAEVINRGEANGPDRTSVVKVCFPDLDSSLSDRGSVAEKASAEARVRSLASAAGDQSLPIGVTSVPAGNTLQATPVGTAFRPVAGWLMASSPERIAREGSADAVTKQGRLLESGLEYGRVTVVQRPTQALNVTPDMVIDTVSPSRIAEESAKPAPGVSSFNTASQVPMSRALGMR